ncbi:transposase [Ginsengibacter hankyongi]|uniref:Transposase n=1 Tax=Ginsengibacter hankyongi TaxID=2607284 RepID=A0A5J5IJJ0_9BACT|nr:transposase [Ginsengibacter hankyongi]
MVLQTYHTEFLTGTIFNWEHLLVNDVLKNVIISSFEWLVQNKKCTINAFVIMPNHIHMLWKISDGFERKDVQGALFSFTAHEFKKHLKKKDAVHLQKYFVNSSDRDYQFWEREPMAKECWTEKFFRQKLNYIHFNPCQQHWNLAASPEEYKWSSARFYETGIKNFSWLSHFNEC